MIEPRCSMCEQPIVDAQKAVLAWWVDRKDHRQVIECGVYCHDEYTEYRCAHAANERPGLLLLDRVPGDFGWRLVARLVDDSWNSKALLSLIKTTEAMVLLKKGAS